MRTRSVLLWLAAVAFFGLGSPATSQTIPSPAPASAPPDTHLVWLRGPAGNPGPRLVLALPDTVWFGKPLQVAAVSCAESPAVEAVDPYAVVTGTRRRGADLMIGLRLYWVGPVRLGWKGDPASLTEVFEVQGRVSDLKALAPVRSPPRPVRHIWRLIAVALMSLIILAALFVGIDRWRRRRRIHGSDMISLPPWMVFARSVDGIVAEGFARPERVGDDLGRLAAALREYVKRRMLVRTSGLPTTEIVGAFTSQAYSSRTGAEIAAVLERIEIVRFRPGGATAAEAREIFAASFAAVSATVGGRTKVGVGGRDTSEIEMIWRRLRDRSEAWSSHPHEGVVDAL